MTSERRSDLRATTGNLVRAQGPQKDFVTFHVHQFSKESHRIRSSNNKPLGHVVANFSIFVPPKILNHRQVQAGPPFGRVLSSEEIATNHVYRK